MSTFRMRKNGIEELSRSTERDIELAICMVWVSLGLGVDPNVLFSPCRGELTKIISSSLVAAEMAGRLFKKSSDVDAATDESAEENS